jgi:hypothetical protein
MGTLGGGGGGGGRNVEKASEGASHLQVQSH